MKKRQAAKELVEEVATRHKAATWLDTLSATDRQYVLDVVEAWQSHPDIPATCVASKLIDVLGIARSRRTVAITLKELANVK